MGRRSVGELLEKLSDWDKDERYMAISDIMAYLDEGKEVDASTESRITSSVLERIAKDPSNDVRSVSVRWVSVSQVVAMCETLCGQLVKCDEGMRDVYLLGGKTVVKDAPISAGHHVATTMHKHLLPGLERDQDEDLRCTVLDLYNDVFRRFGSALAASHDKIVDSLLATLESESDVLRKRASTALGSLAVFLSEGLFERAVTHALNTVERSKDPLQQRTMIQVLATMSAGAGYRMSAHLARAVPLLVRELGSADDEAMENEAGDETRETCFAALQSFVRRCPAGMAQHADEVLAAAAAFVGYDPNYNDDDDDDDDGDDGDDAINGDDDAGGMEEEPDEEDGEDYGDEYEDAEFDDQADDSSWKVRRAALLVIAGVIESRPEALGKVYEECGLLLERELSVRQIVVETLTALFAASVVHGAKARGARRRAAAAAAAGPAPTPLALRRQRSISGPLQGVVPALVKKVPKLARTQGAGSLASKIRAQALAMTCQMVRVVASGDAAALQGDLEPLLPAVLEHRGDASPAIRLEVALVVDAFLEAYPSVAAGERGAVLVEAVCSGARDDWFKVVAAALVTMSPLANALRGSETGTAERAAVVFAALRPWLESADTDHEVREAAIASAGVVVAALGEVQPAAADAVVALLVDRLGNESTRQSSLRALQAVCASPGAASLSLARFAGPFLSAAAGFFRLQDRVLRQHALQAAAAFARHPSVRGAVPEDAAAEAARRLAASVSNRDQYLAALGLRLATALVGDAGCPAAPFADSLVGPALELATGASTSEMAMGALLPFLSTVAAATGTARDLRARVVEPAVKAAELSRDATVNTARCSAALVAAIPPAERAAVVDEIVAALRSGAGQALARRVDIATVGFVGLDAPLARHGDLFDILDATFDGDDEEAKGVAAQAIGCLTASPLNLEAFLPRVIDALASDRHAYHFLTALRGALDLHAAVKTAEALPAVARYVDSDNENTQAMAAECIGHLLAQQPAAVVGDLRGYAAASEATFRVAACNAVRHAVALPDAAAAEASLREVVEAVLGLINDAEVPVRKAALRSLASIAHHTPELVARSFDAARSDGVIDAVAAETVVRPELKKTVDLGPFKHKIDEGLPLRKAAFSCFLTLLDSSPERINVEVVMVCAMRGLGDVDDVQVQCHEILMRVARGWPAHIMNHLEGLLVSADGLAKAVFKKKKRGPAPTGLELERFHEVIRSGLRVLAAVGSISGASDTRIYQDFVHRVREDKSASILYDEVTNP